MQQTHLFVASLIDTYIFVTFVPFFEVQCQILRYICTNISEKNCKINCILYTYGYIKQNMSMI